MTDSIKNERSDKNIGENFFLIGLTLGILAVLAGITQVFIEIVLPVAVLGASFIISGAILYKSND